MDLCSPSASCWLFPSEGVYTTNSADGAGRRRAWEQLCVCLLWRCSGKQWCAQTLTYDLAGDRGAVHSACRSTLILSPLADRSESSVSSGDRLCYPLLRVRLHPQRIKSEMCIFTLITHNTQEHVLVTLIFPLLSVFHRSAPTLSFWIAGTSHRPVGYILRAYLGWSP